MINAVIVDDEQISLNALAAKIKDLCPGLNVLKLFDNPKKAQEEIPLLRPDVVFLDIEMPNINGFTLLKNIGPLNFEVIFTTAYSEYAIAALRISALDFLLKPIDPAELVTAVDKLQEKLQIKAGHSATLEKQLSLFFEYQKQPAQLNKIALPVLNGLELIDSSTIIKVEGENVYSVFYLSGGRKIVVSRTLKEVDKMLSRWNFMRVHKSFIINLNYITRYVKGEGGTVILSDGSEVEVSRRSRNEFLARINK
ncbi:MAG: LytTR family DNA-binding domain-containing protein [Bacteroidota bacterium]|nr:LytTR family DNA-binding domain-containing protein [Bacteroidota bacterium]